MMDGDSARSLLGVSPDASPIDVREAYRRRLRTVHPDGLSSESDRSAAEETLRQVIEAYQLLSNPMPAKVYEPELTQQAIVLPTVKIEEDDYEIPAAIASLALAVAIFGAGLWTVTTHIMPRGISPQSTAYSFIGLFVIWGILYEVLCPVFENRARERASRNL